MIINKFIVFTGPSGVGKATIEKYLFNEKELNLCLSCSATTRKPRDGEINGVHYYFLTMDEFNKKIENDEFVEWNEHFSNKYGTLKSEIKKIQDKNKIPFLEVETIGAKNIMEKFSSSELISFFIAPPSLKELKERIKGRGTENSDQVKERMNRVTEEYKYKDLFQHKIVNDDINEAVSKIKKIILKEL